MGNADPNKTKAGNKYEVKPQYEELSKQINMQHAINQCYECMRLSKEIGQLGQCIHRQNHIKSPLYHGLSTGKSSVRDHRGPSAHHSSAVDTRIRHVHAQAAKGYSNHTLTPQNSTSQSQQSTADLTVCEQIPPSLKITRPKTSSNKSVQGIKTRSSILPNTHDNPKARSYTQVLHFYVGTNIPEQSSNQRKKAHPKDGNARRNLLPETQQLRALVSAQNSLQDWKEKKGLFKRFPTLPRTRKTEVGINGK
ncbi:hypothetical protein F511_39134 [Dorcoceras hygrometricum]|uniref:Uncharacterized protein n=1 Tax=Dorcoceras hygrometricum TaxID=472368 RepID=A0A2Z7CSA6_9LAMI|nr:hypothetical protein F511_39134 [Dorcoceras hygrometricum]